MAFVDEGQNIEQMMQNCSLDNCFDDSCGAADAIFGKLKKIQRVNPRHPDRPARENAADPLLIPSRRRQSAEGRDAYLNQPLIGAGINELANSTIGTGRRIKPEFNAKRLGWSTKQYTDTVNQVKCLWQEHMYSKRKWIDQEGDQTLAEMQRMVMTQTIAVGECYTLGFWFDDPSRPFRTALAIIDDDRVRSPQELTDEQKKVTVAGHVHGPSGRTHSYYIHDWHRNDPRNWERDQAGVEKFTLVRRVNEFGREQVIHTYTKKLPGMTRGLSALAPALEDLKCLDKYKKTRMEAAIAQLAMAVVVKSNDKNILSQIGNNGLGMDDAMAKKLYALSLKKAADSQQYLNDNGLNFDGVKFIRLLESEEAEILTNNQAGINDEQFVRDCLAPVARSTGMSTATLTQNFEASFSAARATLLSFYRQCEMYGHYIVDDWLKSVYAMWLEDIIESGQLVIPKYSDPREAWLHFAANREWYCNAQFAGPARDEIDQAKMMAFWKEVKAIGAFTFQAFHDSQGHDWQEVMLQQFEEMKFMETLIDENEFEHIDPIAYIQGTMQAIKQETLQNSQQPQTTADEDT